MKYKKNWRILLLDTKRSNPNHYLCLVVKRALLQHPDVDFVAMPNLGDAIRCAEDGDCNLFIAFDGEELFDPICRRLAELCDRSVLWVTEDPYERQINQKNADIFDLVFTNDSATVIAYGEKGVHLPLAADPGLHYLDIQEESGYRYDLFFAGTAWPNRAELISQMMHKIKGLKTKLVLPHNEHLPSPSAILNVPESTFSWRMANSQFVRFANSSRVTLTLHRHFTTSDGGAPMANTPGPRLFEVAFAGGFQLVDMTLPEVTRYFEEDREFVGFRTPAEALDKLAYYLSNAHERKAIAQAAQQRALRYHAYAHRIEVLLNRVGSLPGKNPANSVSTAKRKVLQVTHNVVGIQPYGGVEVYQDQLVKDLGGRDDGALEFLYLIPDKTGISHSVRLLDAQYNQILEKKFTKQLTQDVLKDSERESFFAEILATQSIDVVHFQHLLGHVPSLPLIARAMGVRTVLSLHDYYTLCWNINLLNEKGEFCAPERHSEITCDHCTGHLLGGLPGSQTCRRGFYGHLLSRIDILHFNTKEVMNRFCSVYPQLLEHSGKRILGCPIPDVKRFNQSACEYPLRVVIPGNFTPNKGGELLLEVIEVLQHEAIVFDIFGAVDPLFKRHLDGLENARIRVRGGHLPGEQTTWWRGAALALFASKWPETYCLSLSEAWQAGVVPIAPRIGAFETRISDGVNGFLYETGHLGDLIDHLRTLIYDKALRDRVRGQIHPSLYAGSKEHFDEIGLIYSELSRTRSPSYCVDKHLDLTLSDCGVELTSPAWIRRGARPKPAILPSMPTPNLMQKLLNFKRMHGFKATLRRVFHEARTCWG